MWARTLFLLALAGLSTLLEAQTPPAGNLNDLRLDAERKTAEWFTLHKALEDNLSRLLPCDARVRTSIETVNRASEARMEAWIKVNQLWQAQAAGESRNAKQGVADATAQASSLQAQNKQLDSQIADLRRRRAALPPASDASRPLDVLIGLYNQRAGALQERTSLQGLRQLMEDLLAGAGERSAAVDRRAAQLTEQATRWRAYYAARINRASTECGLTGKSTTPRAPRKKR